uniref:Transporter n=1 Tax=Mesocestoides corti TaxID=53468 RepID=A0A5K3F4X3_MESCO
MADLEHGESDYVSPQDKFEPKSTAWYATTPVIKWLYKYTMYGCTNKPVMNEVQLPPDEDHDEEGGEKSIISPSDKEEESEIETEVAPLDEIEVQGEGFSTSFGIFFSCVGSVIGSGNIWRFPRIVAQNSYSEGSAAFLLVWMISLFLWSIPIIIIEFTIGRFTKTGPLLTFGKFLGTKLLGLGTWTIMICYLISTYYNVIVGWCFYYVYYVCAAAELPSNETLSIEIFDTFTQKTSYPVLCHFLSLFLASVCVVGGLSWIEWVNSTLVTILAIILIVTLGWALSLPYADIGIQYLFSPAWYSIAQPRLWIDAFIQNAFDTGAGLGHYAVYAGFFKRTDKSVTYAITLPIINNMVR